MHDPHTSSSDSPLRWALLLIGSTALSCGGRSRFEFQDAFAGGDSGSAGTAAVDRAQAGRGGSADASAGPGGRSDGGLSGGASLGGTGGVGEPNPSDGGSHTAGPTCGDGLCDLVENADSCASDCTGGCSALPDLTNWVNVAPFIATGSTARDDAWLSCAPIDGPDLAFRVELPTAGILRASTESPATNFDTVIAIRSESCTGREISCEPGHVAETGSLGSVATAWLDAHEPAVILLEASDGTIRQFALTLEFAADDFDFDFVGAANGNLEACDVELEDSWGIELVEEEYVSVSVDTLDAASAANLALEIINDSYGNSVAVDETFACTYPAPAGECPSLTFTARTTGHYTFAVSLGSENCGTEAPKYRLEVRRQDGAVELELLEDR